MSVTIDDETYFQSMQENLDDLVDGINNGSVCEKNIKDFLLQNTILTYDFKYELDMSLYRARFDSGFDKTDPSQFGYIHDLSKITRFRYNQDHEAVLYTATFPSTAYLEIEGSRKSETYFYLSIWSHKDGAKAFNCALNVNGNNLSIGSRAERFYNILRNNVGESTSKLYYLETLGKVLEKPGTDYLFSSILASKLFEKHDALITTSMKSQGSELNVTFNQYASDNLLELKYIYRCVVPSNNHTLAYKVDEIGIPQGDKIEWRKWSVDYDSIRFAEQQTIDVTVEQLRASIQTGKDIMSKVMNPNVNKKPDDWQEGVVVMNGKSFKVLFKVKLIN